jgi:hypothetical protein
MRSVEPSFLESLNPDCTPTFDWLGVSVGLLVTLPLTLLAAGLENCSQYPLEGGQARVLLGKVFGICEEVMKGLCMISSRVGLLEGSNTRILVISAFAFSEIVT